MRKQHGLTDQPGSFAIRGTGERFYFHFICPCGCNARDVIPLFPPHGHMWDGEQKTPTLNPSVRRMTCGFFGDVVKGVWVSRSSGPGLSQDVYLPS